MDVNETYEARSQVSLLLLRLSGFLDQICSKTLWQSVRFRLENITMSSALHHIPK